jgi:transposase
VSIGSVYQRNPRGIGRFKIPPINGIKNPLKRPVYAAFRGVEWYNSDMNFAAKLAQFNPDPALAEWLLTQFGDTQKAAHQITVLSADVRNKELKIEALTLELAYHKRLKFGAKAEAFTTEQRDLFTECAETDLSAMQAELEQLSPAAPRAKFKPTGRKALPADLPRIEHRHEPESCSCAQCGNGLVQIAEDISEQLDVEPARFFVHRHIRPQYAAVLAKLSPPPRSHRPSLTAG